MSCIFCQIVQKQIPAYIVFENETSLAFLDTSPLFHGHVLLVPKTHYETLPDVPADEVGPLFQTAQMLCTAVQGGMDAHGTFVAINNTVSQTVPHLHIHVVPRRKKDGLRGFFWPRMKYEGVQSAEQARDRIIAAIAATK